MVLAAAHKQLGNSYLCQPPTSAVGVPAPVPDALPEAHAKRHRTKKVWRLL